MKTIAIAIAVICSSCTACTNDSAEHIDEPGDSMTASFTFTADAGTDVITTSAPHGKVTGDGPMVVRNVGGALPTGYTALLDVYAIVTGASTMKLALSSADALANIPILISDAGTGTHYLEIGIPYRRPRTYAPGVQLKSADLNDNFDAWKALYALLTAQAQSLWATVTLAAEFVINGSLRLTGVISPSALAAGTTSDYNPAGLSSANVLRLTPNAANSTLGGLVGGTNGRTLAIVNTGTAANLVLAHEEVNTAAANQIILANNTNLTLRPNGGATLWYDGTTARWRVVGANE
jgi:hypothetical protein